MKKRNNFGCGMTIFLSTFITSMFACVIIAFLQVISLEIPPEGPLQVSPGDPRYPLYFFVGTSVFWLPLLWIALTAGFYKLFKEF